MNAAAPTAPCVDATELVAFYASAGSHPRAELVRDHLASCHACLELARDARLFLQAVGRPAAAPAGSPRPAAALRRSAWPRTLSWAAAAALVPCAVIVAQRSGIVPAPGGASPRAAAPAPASPAAADEWWRRVAVPRASYAPAPDDGVTWRDAGEAPRPGSFEGAMEPYTRGAYPEAERRLARYLESRPREARALFYRGVTLLLLDRADEAAQCLREAGVARSSFAPEARWYLALALLRSGDTAAAAAPLEATARGSGPGAGEARALLQRLGNAPRR